MPPRKLRVGVIGLGMGASHVRAYARIEGVQLAAICDVDREALSLVARDVPKAIATDDWSLLCELDLDIVSICSPDHLHHRMAKRALEAGAHVMCEKPMTTTLADAQDLLATSRRVGLQLAVGNVNRYEPQFRAMKTMLDQGRLGQLFMVEADYVHDMRRVYGVTPWRIDPVQPQNAWLGGAVHPMDLVRWLAGEVTEIMLYDSKSASTPEFPLPDNYVAILRLENGCVGRVWECSGLRRWPEHVVHLNAYGSEGTVLGDTESRSVTAWLDSDAPGRHGPDQIAFEAGRGHRTEEELQDFVHRLRDGRPPEVDALDGARTIAALEAGLRSAETGRPQAVVRVD